MTVASGIDPSIIELPTLPSIRASEEHTARHHAIDKDCQNGIQKDFRSTLPSPGRCLWHQTMPCMHLEATLGHVFAWLCWLVHYVLTPFQFICYSFGIASIHNLQQGAPLLPLTANTSFGCACPTNLSNLCFGFLPDWMCVLEVSIGSSGTTANRASRGLLLHFCWVSLDCARSKTQKRATSPPLSRSKARATEGPPAYMPKRDTSLESTAHYPSPCKEAALRV